MGFPNVNVAPLLVILVFFCAISSFQCQRRCNLYDTAPIFSENVEMIYGRSYDIEFFNDILNPLLPNCTLEDMVTDFNNISLIFTTVDSLQRLVVNDTAVQAQIDWIVSLNSIDCSSNSTNTVALLACRTWNVTASLRNNISSTLYPFAGNPDYMHEAGRQRYLNTSLYQFFNRTMSWNPLNLTQNYSGLIEWLAMSGGGGGGSQYTAKPKTSAETLLNGISFSWDSSVTKSIIQSIHRNEFDWNRSYRHWRSMVGKMYSLGRTILKPVGFAYSVVTHPDFSPGVKGTIQKIESIRHNTLHAGRMDDFLQHHANLQLVQRKTPDSMNGLFTQIQHICQEINDHSTSKNIPMRMLYMGQNWQSPSDPVAIFDPASVYDWFHLVATGGSVLFWVQNQYTTCWTPGKYFPYGMVETQTCKYPEVKLLGQWNLFGPQFNPNNPQCGSYLNPILWSRTLANSIVALTPLQNLIVSSDWKYFPGVDFLVYQPRGASHTLPDNAVPCTIGNSIIVIGIIVVSVSFSCCLLGGCFLLDSRVLQKVNSDAHGFLSANYPTLASVAKALSVSQTGTQIGNVVQRINDQATQVAQKITGVGVY